MAVTYSTAAKTARMGAVIAQIDAGAGPGTLEIGTTGFGTVLAILTLADPSGTASAGVLTFDFDPDISDTSANGTGTAAEARIKDSDGTVVISGLTVSTSGADINLDSVSITTGQTVTLTTGTITHA
jgi:polyisoprenoid-binding protein YceI